MPHHHCGVVKIERLGKRERGAGGHRDQFGKSAGPLDAHHAGRTRIAFAVLGARRKRHHPGCGDVHSFLPTCDARADCIDDAGAIDAGDERQDRSARGLFAGAQAHVEHAVDGRGMDADANLAFARDRVRHVLVAENLGRTIFAKHDRFHAGLNARARADRQRMQ